MYLACLNLYVNFLHTTIFLRSQGSIIISDYLYRRRKLFMSKSWCSLPSFFSLSYLLHIFHGLPWNLIPPSIFFLMLYSSSWRSGGPFIMFSKENRFLLRATFLCTNIMGSLSMLQTMKIPRDDSKTYLWTQDT